MGCEPHGLHRSRLTPDNARLFQRRPSDRKDADWVKRYREWWNRSIEAEKRERAPG